VTYVVVPAGSQLSSLLAEAIHVAILNPDLSATAAAQGFRVLRTVEDLGRVLPGPFSGFVVEQSALQRKPDMLKAWIRGNLKGLHFVRDNPRESGRIAASVFSLDPGIAEEAAVRTVPALDARDLGGFTAEGFRDEIANNVRVLGGQAPVTRIEDLADLTLLRQAQRELGLPCGSGYQCR
jgi:ABC-type nitrate/sulfonate/bicarbonate transport system substrate-binding protein